MRYCSGFLSALILLTSIGSVGAPAGQEARSAPGPATLPKVNNQAPLVPRSTDNKNLYIQRASRSLDRWEGVTGELRQAMGVAPALSNERRAIQNTLDTLDRTKQELFAQLDILRVADKTATPKLEREMQAGFRLMKKTFDSLPGR